MTHERCEVHGNGKVRRRRWGAFAILVTVSHLLGAVSSLEALMTSRTSAGAIAWIVSLNTMPLVAVPTYWIFGRNKFEGYITSRRDDDLRLSETLEEELEALRTGHAAAIPDGSYLAGIEDLARLPLLEGNDLTLLIDGEQTYRSLLEGIDAAEDYLLVQFYIVRDDDIGTAFQQRLIEKAQEGVDVYFLYDEIGSYALPSDYLRALREGGVKVQRFPSTRGPGKRFQLNFRNHRKVMVADGERAWIGGFNLGDEYWQGHEELGPWRDTHLAVAGPAALALQLVFLEDWLWASDDILELAWEPVTTERQAPVMILPSGPADRFETASLMVQQAIHAAKERIWISSPYFVPDDGVQTMLKLAALNGIDVRILIPERQDNLLPRYATYAFLGPMLDAGVKIYRYRGGFLHGKSFVIDDAGAAVGTVNLDNRSFRLNFEVTALVMEPDFAREVAAMFEEDFSRSTRIEQEAIAERPLWHRIAARGAYLFAPVL
ncbi:cardiolipin synthase [Billgrantia pellis]|uniref:Cardiolipin synthase n=1 Tax=Billgrantia pellis TaxID=2606936 RepID=A0A7V7KFJ9_9GAMM|nr:cardiolipin synthase [Halomonas pellis]KAA0011133.1 cardiolipin synthase [Halomonas pellis]